MRKLHRVAIGAALAAGIGVAIFIVPNGVFKPGSSEPAHPGPKDADGKPAWAALAGHASTIDGDTIDIDGRTVRLFGIDAPELNQECQRSSGASWACGVESRRALATKIDGKWILCQSQGKDSDGYMIGKCYAPVGGTPEAPTPADDVSGMQLRAGWAVMYRRYSAQYEMLESIARDAKRGIWAGKFELPDKWRQSHLR